MPDDPAKLREYAEHCRQAARFVDPVVAADLLEIATRLEAKALRIEAHQRETERLSAKRPTKRR
jgi:hypothetical protein